LNRLLFTPAKTVVRKSTLTGNGEWGVEAEGGSGSVDVFNSDLSGNTDGEVELELRR